MDLDDEAQEDGLTIDELGERPRLSLSRSPLDEQPTNSFSAPLRRIYSHLIINAFLIDKHSGTGSDV
jgi:hypothetical protein